jgi:hypothetical protein
MIEIGLLVLVMFQQVYWTWHCHKLVNKLMSRDFYEYKQALKVSNKQDIKIQTPIDLPEDLRPLQEFVI